MTELNRNNDVYWGGDKYKRFIPNEKEMTLTLLRTHSTWRKRMTELEQEIEKMGAKLQGYIGAEDEHIDFLVSSNLRALAALREAVKLNHNNIRYLGVPLSDRQRYRDEDDSAILKELKGEK